MKYSCFDDAIEAVLRTRQGAHIAWGEKGELTRLEHPAYGEYTKGFTVVYPHPDSDEYMWTEEWLATR